MKPTSVFVATFVKGDEDYPGDEWSYPTCISYTLETMQRIVADAGLRCDPVDWDHRSQTLILITFPEAGIEIPEVIPR